MDQYSVGFPSTESGIEIEILKKLFTEQEAEMYLNLSMMLETAQDVAKRMSTDSNQVGPLLERMFEKGQIFRVKKGGVSKYGAAPFVVGYMNIRSRTWTKNLLRCSSGILWRHSAGMDWPSPLH